MILRDLRLKLAATFFLVLLLSLAALPGRAVNLVEEFYLPLPESQLLAACRQITPAVTDTNFATITSVLVTGDGTLIYYDQWEDGYESNLGTPSQTTTIIWGDGINANGICPGFTNDPAGLQAGTVIVLTNTVPSSPRNPAVIFYDGRDRLGANKALVVTRAGWPAPTGPVFGGSSVVQPTIDWGTNFVSPIGQDMAENLFKYTGFFVMASQNGTAVSIDPDGPGPLLATVVTLNQGESYFYAGGGRRGGTVNASKPVEVNLVCGDTVNTFAIDWFTLYPQSAWSDTYYNPVGSANVAGTLFPTFVYFYNNNSTPLTIFYTNLLGAGNFSVPVNGGFKFQMPTNSGAAFNSAGNVPFTVLATVASSPSNAPTSSQDATYNWGFTPLPKGSLTTEADVGWAPGSSDFTGNGSPIWVTPTAATRVYVDYRGDHLGPLTDPNGNKYDTNLDLVALQSKTIYVPGTNDQTGLRVYTLDGTLLSVAWGEDPNVAGTGNPYLDLGNPVLPFPLPRLLKSSVILTDSPPAGLSVGDTLQYTLQIDNKGLLPLGNTIVQDAPPPALTYLTNSTTVNGAPIPDSTNGTAFPLDSPGYTIPIILSEGTSVIQYQAVIIAAGSIINSASLNGTGITVTNTVAAVAANPSLLVSKTILTPSTGIAGVGQTMQFNLQIINNGNIPLANVALTDLYPSNKFSFVTASLAPNSVTNGLIIWTNLGSFPVGYTTNITVSLLATNTAAAATNFATATSPGSTTNTGRVNFTINAQPTAALTVNKTLVSPMNGAAGIGSTVQYNLQVFNSGFTTFTNLTLTDNFPGTNFNFVSASVAPSATNTASLLWTNLGSFAPGQITNITVNFLVTNYSALVTNFATATAAGSATNTGNASLPLSRSGLTITKTVLTPTNFPVSLGSNIVFRIQLKNTGTTTITRLPLEDTFSASYFQYLSATIAPSTIAAGNLIWTNLAAPPLYTNATLTFDITLRVTGGASNALNTAAASFAYDTNNTAVAPATGNVTVPTAAASISGHTYLDPDLTGTLTPGDTALPDITLTLYTDPDADGNPADGALAQTIISDHNGAYELLNLPIGNYVLVQTVLPGHTGTAPALNRTALNVTSLTAFTNNNFFQYPTPVAAFATVAGTVWNDLAGDGIYHPGDYGLTNAQLDLIQDLNSNRVVDAGETIVQTVFSGTNGTYTFVAVTPGSYVIRETDLPGYQSTGDTQGTNDNQISIHPGNGAVTNGNDFYDFYFGLANPNSPPIAIPDFASTLENVPVTIFAVTNDNSPGGFALTITNVAATNGVASIIGGTNVLFTPTANFSGTATIGYTATNANGKSTALITVTVIPVADLSILKSGPASVLAASNFNYTLTISNSGPGTASNVIVTDALPAAVTFVSATGNGSLNAGVVTWTIPALTAFQSTNLVLIVTAPTGGSLTNSASVSSTTTETNYPNNSTPPVITAVTPVANLAIGKSGVASVAFGSNFNYTISVTNLGPSTAANLSVTDSLPAGIIFVSATPSTTTNALNQVIWPSFGALATNSTTNLTLTVKAVARGAVTNIATVGGPTLDNSPTNNTSTPVITSITNRPPLAVNDSTSTTENVGVTIPLLVNDSDPDGDALTIISLNPTNGTASLSGTNLNFLPPANFIGTATIGYTIIDGFGGTNSALITILVTNIPPIANPDTYFVDENAGTNALSPLNNDLLQTPGGILGLTGVTTTNGHVAVSGILVLFAPTTNFIGTTTLIYYLTDNIGGTNTGVITINVLNQPPVAQNDSAATPKNISVTVPVLLNDYDSNYNPLTIVSVMPTNGLAFISSTNVIFTPTNNFLGTTFIGYTITDGNGGTNSAVISVLVTNRVPVAVNDSISAPENVAVTIPVLTNDSDPDSDTLTIISVNPTNGTASISGTNIFFTPATNFIGTATIGYFITDNFGGTNSALVTVSITNRPPVANPDGYAITENTTNTFAVLTNDFAVTPGGILQIISVTPTNGTAIISGTNLVFTPAPNFLGTATIGYTITDGIGGTNSSLVTVLVTNIPPLANPDNYSVAQNSTNNLLLPLVNDLVRTPGGFLNLISLAPTNGAAVISGTNVLFTPAPNFAGLATIGYVITDNVGGTNSSLITINVTNRPPVAQNDSAATPMNTAVTVTPLVNDSDPDGNPLTLVSVAPTNGTANISGTNVVFTPATNFIGTATVGYTITDGFGGSNSALIFISVTNRPPVAQNDFASTPKNVPVTVPALENDSDPDNNPLTLVSIASTNGIANISGTNIIFTPATNFIGIATAGYVITDGFGGTNFALITISVTNRPPVAINDSTSTTENVAVTIPILTNDTDPDGDVLTVISVSPTNGTASISGTNIVFTPTTNFIGTATIGYFITDNFGGTNSALVTILVTNIPPIANPDSYAVAENSANNLLFPLANDAAQTPGGILNLVGWTPTNGTAVIAGTNVLFSPASNFVGTATIGYVITDGIGGTNNSLITVTVTNVPPLASPDAYAVAQNSANNLLLPLVNDLIRTPGGFLGLVSLAPTNGIAVISGTNVLFTPATNFLGTVTIGYVITDNLGGTNGSLITVSVTNRPPVAVNDAATTGINLPVVIAALLNDSDPDGNPLALVSVSPTNGAAIISGTNIVFTPATNFTGTGFVRYIISDGNGGSNSALVTITVTNIVSVPVANGQAVSTPENTAKTITLTGSDPLNHALTFSIVANPTNGVLSGLNTNTGAVVYTPGTNYFGADAFSFRVNNGQTNSAVAVVSIAVLPVADLAVMKSGALNGVAGSNLVYTITVTNRGPAGATNVVVTDALPNGFTFVSASAGGTVSNNFVNWNFAGLAAGRGTNLTVTAYSLEGGTFTNIAGASSPTLDLNVTNNNGSLTNAQVRTVVSALADVAIFKTGGTNVFAGATVDYVITATNMGPSSASVVVVQDILPGGSTFQSASGSYVLTNGSVMWAATNLARNTSATFTLTMVASTVSNSFINVALGTSATPDPVLTNNNGSSLKSRVSTKIIPSADVAVLMYGPSNVVVGGIFVYTIVVTNMGPSSASNVVLVDSVPGNLNFVSVSGSGVLSNGVVTWPKVPKLVMGGWTNYLLTVSVPGAGAFTNVALASSTTADPNGTNNNGSLPVSQVQTVAAVSQFDWLQGAPVFNPQTGLYEEPVIVTNIGATTVAGVRLYVTGLRSGVSLWNAGGTNNGVVYVQYNFPLNPSNTVTFALEFYNPSRLAFSNTVSAVAILPPNQSNTGTNGSIAITKIFADTRIVGDTRYVIEFATIPGRTYTVIYSDDLATWKVATPSVLANVNVTQWYDDGPPKTESKSASRYYRVIQN